MPQHLKRSFVVSLLCLFLTSTAWSQDKTENQMTPAQLQLNNEASLLLRKENPDLDLAYKKINEAISKGKRIDVLLLTLARVYQLKDECPKASKLLDEIDLAPHDSRVPLADIKNLRQEYLQQMRSRCSSTLKFTCKTPTIFNINKQTLTCNQPFKIKTGAYQVEAKQGKRTHTFTKNVNEGMRVYTHAFVMPKAAVNKTIVIKDPGFGYTRTTIAGVSTVVIGGVLTTASILYDRSADEAYDRYKTQTTVEGADSEKRTVEEDDASAKNTKYAAIGAFAIGSVVTGIFGILDYYTIKNRKESIKEQKKKLEPSVSFMPTRDGFQTGIQFRF